MGYNILQYMQVKCWTAVHVLVNDCQNPNDDAGTLACHHPLSQKIQICILLHVVNGYKCHY